MEGKTRGGCIWTRGLEGGSKGTLDMTVKGNTMPSRMLVAVAMVQSDTVILAPQSLLSSQPLTFLPLSAHTKNRPRGCNMTCNRTHFKTYLAISKMTISLTSAR